MLILNKLKIYIAIKCRSDKQYYDIVNQKSIGFGNTQTDYNKLIIINNSNNTCINIIYFSRDFYTDISYIYYNNNCRIWNIEYEIVEDYMPLESNYPYIKLCYRDKQMYLHKRILSCCKKLMEWVSIEF